MRTKKTKKKTKTKKTQKPKTKTKHFNMYDKNKSRIYIDNYTAKTQSHQIKTQNKTKTLQYIR